MPYRDPQALSHFEELDRQSKAHHAAMNKKLGGGNYFQPLGTSGPQRVESIARRVLPWVVLAAAAFLLWVALR